MSTFYSRQRRVLFKTPHLFQPIFKLKSCPAFSGTTIGRGTESEGASVMPKTNKSRNTLSERPTDKEKPAAGQGQSQ